MGHKAVPGIRIPDRNCHLPGSIFRFQFQHKHRRFVVSWVLLRALHNTHGTYGFTSHPKDEAIMVKCLAQGHKRLDRPGRDSNPHSDNTDLEPNALDCSAMTLVIKFSKF